MANLVMVLCFLLECGIGPGHTARAHQHCTSASWDELVLCFRLKVASVVAFVQLARRFPGNAVDHAPAPHGWPFQEHVGPSLYVLVVLHAQKLCGPILPA